jgi:nicotinamidase-related amidase
MRDALVRWVLAMAALAAPISVPAQQPAQKAEATVSQTKRALLVIDIQEFYFPGGRLALTNPEAASEQARRLLDRFRAKKWPVIHVQHLPKAQSAPTPESGDPQYRIHPNVLPLPGETVIGKHFANSFRDTELLATLRKLGVTSVVISGMQTHMCVEAAARAAADLGFEVTVVRDACATRALEFDGLEIPAGQVHAATLAALANSYAHIVSTEQALAELN